jgi:hypothetical protein
MNLKMKRIYAIALLLGLPLSENLLGQGQSSQKIIFHVTAVRQNEAQDYCTEANCSATRFTVEGYSDASSDSRIQYLLECVEVIPNGTVHPTIGCVHLHANNDYAAELWDDSIYFPTSASGFIANYKIKSEKSVTK